MNNVKYFFLYSVRWSKGKTDFKVAWQHDTLWHWKLILNFQQSAYFFLVICVNISGIDFCVCLPTTYIPVSLFSDSIIRGIAMTIKFKIFLLHHDFLSKWLKYQYIWKNCIIYKKLKFCNFCLIKYFNILLILNAIQIDINYQKVLKLCNLTNSNQLCLPMYTSDNNTSNTKFKI